MESSVTDVLEHISDAFYALDFEWRFTYVNARAARRWGRPPAEMIGRCFWEAFPQVLGTQAEQEHRRALAEQVPAHYEVSSPVFGGWLEVSIYPAGEGLSVYFRDVSSRTRVEQELRRDEAEEALRRSERMYRALIQQAGEGVWLTDLAGRIHEVNPAACEMLGYSRAELLERPVTELFPVSYVERRQAELQRMREGATITSARQMIRKDGGVLLVEGTARLVSSDLVLSFTRDITEREATQAALRASDERYRAFLAQSSEGIWRCELDEPIPVDLPAEAQVDLMYQRAYLAECNDAFAQMYGLSGTADLVGARLGDLLVRTDPANTEYLLAFIASGYRLENAESHEQDAEGHPKVFLNNLVGFIEEGRIVRAWGLQRDVSEQRRVELENAQFYSELQDADRRKDQFLAMLAHELRNPLAPIAASAELLRALPDDPENVHRQTDVISRNADHLARMVDDLLEVSRITQDKISLRLSPTDLLPVVQQAVTNVRLQLEAKRQRLSLELPPHPVVVPADGTRLVQVLVNLLSNASKYSGEGDPIRLILELEPEGAGQRAVLRVTDGGCGIERSLLPRVFDLFVQGDLSLAHAQGGLGIGLTLVRRLVEMHGGHVEARSEGVGRGAEFVVTLPDAATEALPEAVLTKVAGTAAPGRVLVVDDNVDAAETLAELLALWGHEVEIAHDGFAALAAVSGFRPSLILLDLGLPGLDGYEVARRLAGTPEREHARLVALTGYAGEDHRRRTAELGFDGHFGKPVDPEALKTLLAELAES